MKIKSCVDKYINVENQKFINNFFEWLNEDNEAPASLFKMIHLTYQLKLNPREDWNDKGREIFERDKEFWFLGESSCP